MNYPTFILTLSLLFPFLAHAAQQGSSKGDIPKINYSGTPLSEVIDDLRELSIQYDTTTTVEEEKGINFILLDPEKINPRVHITLRHVSMEKALNYITRSVDFEWYIDKDVVVIQPNAQLRGQTETRFYALPRSTVIRLIGPGEPGRTREQEEQLLKEFFTKAGVPFE